jgi:transposase
MLDRLRLQLLSELRIPRYGRGVCQSDTSALLTEWKKQDDLQFLSEVSCVPLQQGLRHLQKAFSNFFEGRAKYPTFKKKRNGGSAEFTKSAFKFRNGQVFLAKCSLAVAYSLESRIAQRRNTNNYRG